MDSSTWLSSARGRRASPPRCLVAARVATLVLEAKPWIGGRTVTDHETFGFPYDLGASWLTGYAENPWRRIADGAFLEGERAAGEALAAIGAGVAA